MATAGGSHTNFDTTAFSVGAVAGASTLAGAVGAGIQNYRAAQQQRHWVSWTIAELRGALDLSESFRRRERRLIEEQRLTIAAQARTIADLNRQIRTATARATKR